MYICNVGMHLPVYRYVVLIYIRAALKTLNMVSLGRRY